MAAFKSLVQFGVKAANSSRFNARKVFAAAENKRQSDGFSLNFGGSSVSSSSSSIDRFGCRHFSQLVAPPNGKPANTLALVRSLEEAGVPSKQAEAILKASTQLLKEELQKEDEVLQSTLEKLFCEIRDEIKKAATQEDLDALQENVKEFQRNTNHFKACMIITIFTILLRNSVSSYYTS